MSHDDEIDMALTGAGDETDDDTAQRRARSGKLWLQAPAINSPELELRAAKCENLAAVNDVAFTDEEVGGKVAADAELVRQHANDTALFDWHISLARSLPESATWADYQAACKAEGIKPMPPYGGSRG